jgi:hypothetical protein
MYEVFASVLSFWLISYRLLGGDLGPDIDRNVPLQK